jgi:hypothetical protein
VSRAAGWRKCRRARHMVPGHCGPLLIYCLQEVTRFTRYGSRACISPAWVANAAPGAAQKGDNLTSLVARFARRPYWMVRRATRRFFRQLSVSWIVWRQLHACQRYWYNKVRGATPALVACFPRPESSSPSARSLRRSAAFVKLALPRQHAAPASPDSRSQLFQPRRDPAPTQKGRALLVQMRLTGKSRTCFTTVYNQHFHDWHGSRLVHMQGD